MLVNNDAVANILEYIVDCEYVGLVEYVRDLADWCYQVGRRENVSERSTTVGCLWYDREKNRFSGYIDAGIFGQIKIMVFPNERRQSEKSPHWNIVLQKPREEKRKPYMEAPDIHTQLRRQVMDIVTRWMTSHSKEGDLK